MQFLVLSIALVTTVAATACSKRDVDARTEVLEAEEQRDLLEGEIRKRANEIEGEIARLGPDHAWAGKYYAGDGLCVNVRLWVAPNSGCLATWRGCLGLYGANWGRIQVDGSRLTVVFEHPNTVGEFGCFDSTYAIEGSGKYR